MGEWTWRWLVEKGNYFCKGKTSKVFPSIICWWQLLWKSKLILLMIFILSVFLIGLQRFVQETDNKKLFLVVSASKQYILIVAVELFFYCAVNTPCLWLMLIHIYLATVSVTILNLISKINLTKKVRKIRQFMKTKRKPVMFFQTIYDIILGSQICSFVSTQDGRWNET